jgi:hypothetical protein
MALECGTAHLACAFVDRRLVRIAALRAVSDGVLAPPLYSTCVATEESASAELSRPLHHRTTTHDTGHDRVGDHIDRCVVSQATKNIADSVPVRTSRARRASLTKNHLSESRSNAAAPLPRRRLSRAENFRRQKITHTCSRARLCGSKCTNFRPPPPPSRMPDRYWPLTSPSPVSNGYLQRHV